MPVDPLTPEELARLRADVAVMRGSPGIAMRRLLATIDHGEALLAFLHTITVAMGDRTLEYVSENGTPMAIVFGEGSAIPSGPHPPVTDETFAALSAEFGVSIKVVS